MTSYPSIEKLEAQITGFEKQLEEMKKHVEELKKQTPAPCPLEDGKEVKLSDHNDKLTDYFNSPTYNPRDGTFLQIKTQSDGSKHLVIIRKFYGESVALDEARSILGKSVD